MKRAFLGDDYKYLEDRDLSSLNVGKGTIEVLDPDSQVDVPFKLTGVQISLVKYAYERGLKRLPLY